MKNVVVGGTYRHYKGNLYYVLAIGKDSETLEDVVVYIPLYEPNLSSVWVRPLAMFTEDVVVEGKAQPRFKQIP